MIQWDQCYFITEINMIKDPRFKNELPSTKNAYEYLTFYTDHFSDALKKVSSTELDKAEKLLLEAIANNKRIYSAGNGGSASIGDHLCCDWMKGTHVPGKPGLRVNCLSTNTAVLTAISNDFSYEKSFSMQLEMLGEKEDVVVLISSSGNSPNIVEAAKAAQKIGMKIIGMSGFSGGKLNELADVKLHVPANNYGIAEDAHQSLMHILTHRLNMLRDPR